MRSEEKRLAAIGEAQPEAGAALLRLREAAWQSTDEQLLEICGRRATEMLNGHEITDVEASPREQAYLDFTEQFVTSVSSVSNEDVARLLEHDSDDAVFAFAGALYALEMSERVAIVSGEILR